MPHRFWCQIYVTGFDVGLNVVLEGLLVVFLSQQLASFFDAKMAGQRVVVISADKLSLNGFKNKQ